MPTYDYRCDVCGHRTEVVHSVHGHGPRVCPNCGADGSMRKLMSAPAIVFKGSGWAKKDRSATAAPGKTHADRSAEASSGDKDGAGAKTAEPKTPEPKTPEPKTAEAKAAPGDRSTGGSSD